MNDTIICPNCKKPIPLTQALSHQIQEKYQKFYKIRLEEEKQKLAAQLKEEAVKKAKEELEVEIKDKSNEIGELRKQNKALQEQLLELNRLIRQLKTENERARLELEKKLALEQEKIREQEQRRLNEEYRLKILEKDKKLGDALKLVEEYKRKLEQGSQQLQGEILELELENILRKEFSYDEISEVPKGVKGADVLQIVRNNSGRPCGTIIWESKRTKAWSHEWLRKLKEDQRQVNAEIAVLVTNVLPEGIKRFGLRDEVWICDYESFVSLTILLRDSLIKIASVKISIAGKKEKKEILWDYLTGVEFKQRIEAILEAYNQLQQDIEKEKRWFNLKWAKEEKNIRQVIDNILGMSGDLQGIVGKSLPEIKGLEALPSGKGEDKLF